MACRPAICQFSPRIVALRLEPLRPLALVLPFLPLSGRTQQAAYYAIIAGEALTGLAFAAGTVEMARNLRSDGGRFCRSKRFVYLGGSLGFLGEWQKRGAGRLPALS